MPEEEILELEGVVEDVIYANDETGYYVLEVSVEDQPVTVVGNLPSVFAGETIHAFGRFTTHATYGRQFVCEEVEKSAPDGTENILKFLQSGAIRGVGPARAEKIVEMFGADTFDIMENEPLRLTAVSGISADLALKIGDGYRLTVGMRDLLMYLNDLSIPPSFAIKIYKEYAGMTQQVVESNPYRLWEDIDGFPFEKAEQVALELCMDPLCAQRVQAMVKYILSHNLQNGHTFLPYEKLLQLVMQCLEVDQEFAEIAIENMCEGMQLVRRKVGQTDAVYLREYFVYESKVAEKLLEMSEMPPHTISDIEKQIDKLEQRLGLGYAEQQRAAIRGAIEHHTMVLTGGPGTGKTTTLNGIILLMEQLHFKVELCAPTGRAAKRMSEVCDRPAKTIHRLLELQPGVKNGFTYDAQNPLSCDVVIVDETSMVDIVLMHHLLGALRPGTRLILVGDADQLPSVGPGNVFRDIIRSEAIYTVTLTEIFRQAQRSAIVRHAHDINRGIMPSLVNTDDFFFVPKSSAEGVHDAVKRLVKDRIPKVYKKDAFSGVQVISPTKKSQIGTVSLNETLQNVLNPKTDKTPFVTRGNREYRAGDKVMQIKNNYDLEYTRPDGAVECGVFNGDIGYIEKIYPKEKYMTIVFDDRRVQYPFEVLDQLDLAYAVTVHKSQGSEFDIVVLVAGDMSNMLQYRHLLYTAVTRARELLLIVGNEGVIERMVANNKQTNRYSGLRYLLRQ